jgi:hypothetical protein
LKLQPLGLLNPNDAYSVCCQNKPEEHHSLTRMQEQAIQELFDELQSSTPDATDDNYSCPDEQMNSLQESSAKLREVALLLEIASRANRRPMRPARPIETSTLSSTPSPELPPPAKYSRQKKGSALP